MSIKEKILTAFFPAKLIEYNPFKGKKTPIQTTYTPKVRQLLNELPPLEEITRPLSLISKATLEKLNKTLKALEAEGVYKKVKKQYLNNTLKTIKDKLN